MSTAVVIGASLAGLLAAAALARAGHEVRILERDELPNQASSRRGVPQGAQVHIVLEQGWLCAEALLPGVRAEVAGAGAARFDSGRMPWLGEYGWLACDRPGYPMASLTRPLLELIVRRRVLALPGVTLCPGHQVRGLSRSGQVWTVHSLGATFPADLVVDASGRSSRLPVWLGDLGISVPAPEEVDAHLGYATRLYAAPKPLPLRTGVVVMGTPVTGTGGLAMPVENGRWLLMGGGYGGRRPPRDAAGFEKFLADLRDPVLFELAERLEPLTEVTTHRQTGNRRHRFESVPGFPDGLLVVGDAAAAFNPVYGQGISVAANQAVLLGRALAAGRVPDRRLQRRLSEAADLPWLIATGADRRDPSSDHRPDLPERLFGAWSERAARLVTAGDPVATTILAQIYNLRAPLAMLFHPLLVDRVIRSTVRPPEPLPRPAVLDEILAVAPVRQRVAA